jgi:hypothetical protein
MDHMDHWCPHLVLERSCHTDHQKVACLSPSPVHLHLVGGAAVDTFYLLGTRWGVDFVDLKKFVFLLLLLIVFEGISCQVRFLGM